MKHKCEYLTYVHLSANWWDNPGTVNCKEGGRKWSQLEVWYCLWMDDGLSNSGQMVYGLRSGQLEQELRTLRQVVQGLRTVYQLVHRQRTSRQLVQGLRTLGQLVYGLRTLYRTAGPLTEDLTTAGPRTEDLCQDSHSKDRGPQDGWLMNWGS
jgi:hypothetical protein